MYMVRRTTIEIDEELLARARHVLGGQTIRATVEEALRHVIDHLEDERDRRADRQRRYLDELGARADLGLLASEEMWR